MYTINDYIKNYKSITIDEVKWNVMDYLICAILIYLPVSSFKEKISLVRLNLKCKK